MLPPPRAPRALYVSCISGFVSVCLRSLNQRRFHIAIIFFSISITPHILFALYGNCVSACISSQGWDSNQMRFHIAIIFFSILIYLWHNTLGKEVILLNSYFLFEFVLQKSWNIKVSAKLLSCTVRFRFQDGLCTVRSHVWQEKAEAGWVLYSEVQCITGSNHMGPLSHLWTEWLIDGQTHEKITFLELRWRAVISYSKLYMRTSILVLWGLLQVIFVLILKHVFWVISFCLKIHSNSIGFKEIQPPKLALYI